MGAETKEFQQMLDEFKGATAEVKAAREKHEAEVKELGAAQAETKAALEAAEKKWTDAEGKFEKIDAALKELQALKARGPNFGDEHKTMGARFVESQIFEELKANNRGNSMPFEIDRKDIVGTAASAGALVRPQRDPEVYRSIGGYRPLRIRDLLPTLPVQSGSVEIMRQNAFTNNAGPQQAASTPSSAAGGGEFEAKPQSSITWELVTKPVRTIAHWVPASRQVLSDAPMLSSLIDTELAYGLDLESDAQILLGDGAGQNIDGILLDNSINDIGEIEAGTSADDLPGAMIDHIRSGVTECQKFEYYNMNGIVLNPVDWETLETAKATDGHYLMVAFASTSPEAQSIWRIPVVVTNAMPEGQFLLGDWRLGAKLYTREGISIRVSESHADYFVKNGVAVLAEERYTLGVNRPKAFCTGLFTVAAP